jgi:hypothetical protein
MHQPLEDASNTHGCQISVGLQFLGAHLQGIGSRGDSSGYTTNHGQCLAALVTGWRAAVRDGRAVPAPMMGAV